MHTPRILAGIALAALAAACSTAPTTHPISIGVGNTSRCPDYVYHFSGDQESLFDARTGDVVYRAAATKHYPNPCVLLLKVGR